MSICLSIRLFGLSVYIILIYNATFQGPERAISEEDSPDGAGVSQLGNEVVEWRLTEALPEGPIGGGVLEVRLPAEGRREADLGRTIQFLAEENVRLRHKNADLKAQLRDIQGNLLGYPCETVIM